MSLRTSPGLALTRVAAAATLKPTLDWRLCLCTELHLPSPVSSFTTKPTCLFGLYIPSLFSYRAFLRFYLFDLLWGETVIAAKVLVTTLYASSSFRTFIAAGRRGLSSNCKVTAGIVNKGCAFHNTSIIALIVVRWSSDGISAYVNRQHSLMGRAGVRCKQAASGR